MSYIWENYSADKVYAVGDRSCPYMEIFNESSQHMEVNPLLRFAELFERLHDDALMEYIDNRKAVDNVLFHFLAQLDKCKGMNYLQCLIEKLREEVALGYYGQKLRSSWYGLSVDEQNVILYEMAQSLLKRKHCFFMDAMNKLFDVSSLCYEKETHLYYLYIGAEQNASNVNKYEVVRSLFWNKNLELIPVWERHYGIVGVDDTMHVGSIQII